MLFFEENKPIPIFCTKSGEIYTSHEPKNKTFCAREGLKLPLFTRLPQ